MLGNPASPDFHCPTLRRAVEIGPYTDPPRPYGRYQVRGGSARGSLRGEPSAGRGQALVLGFLLRAGWGDARQY